MRERGPDEGRKFLEIGRELLLLVVATVVLDLDELLGDQPLDLCNAHSWRHPTLPDAGIASMSALLRKEQPSWPDACWDQANLDSPFGR
jgi:hypothetical protein